MKQALSFFGMALIVIFGGGFLIRLIRDGDFYIAEFAGGVIGLVLLVMALVVKLKGEKEERGF
ncbi:hypothetical protein AS034_01055 [[Bacillus] enclensis]|uniref:Uncharacterized protein n=1 Tax=[Bacillus] enclensis TaxID=1402860 RepID=A0A0V8HPH6_9BACI|nr:hypothetical protein [[Bacillus] enclensis]KSU64460.1 hypothetical protein AS034_01055 [[Bacillus] enclensis]SCB74450.1 hypothetical protein GA0061094_0219 [[Bacillus] enclensis]